MDVDYVTRMSYWYPLLGDYSIESYSYRCSEELVEELEKAFFTAVESDPFKISARLLEKYMGLRGFLEKYIGLWKGVFIRGDKASPKDACWELGYWQTYPLEAGLVVMPDTQHNACISLRPETALALIISSERVIMIGDPSILWVRRPTRIKQELRVFVKDLKPRLISWYYPEEPPRYPPAIINRIDELEELIGKIHDKTQLNDFVLDTGFVENKLVIVELTPFPTKKNPRLTDPIMFRNDFWKKLEQATNNNKTIIRYPILKQEINEKIIG